MSSSAAPRWGRSFPMLIEFSADPAPFDRFCDRLDSLLDPSGPGAFRDGLHDASEVYMDHMLARFLLFSDRGGDWPEHAPYTQKRRGVGAPILIETGQLLESLQRGAPGHVLEDTADGVREGTEDRTAYDHQHGNPTRNLPARTILVEPDGNALDDMKKPLVEAVKRAVSEASRG